MTVKLRASPLVLGKVMLTKLWKTRTSSSSSPVISVNELCSKLDFLPNFLIVVSSDPNSLIRDLNIDARSTSTNLIHVRENSQACVGGH
jgi:hypothetical protein